MEFITNNYNLLLVASIFIIVFLAILITIENVKVKKQIKKLKAELTSTLKSSSDHINRLQNERDNRVQRNESLIKEIETLNVTIASLKADNTKFVQDTERGLAGTKSSLVVETALTSKLNRQISLLNATLQTNLVAYDGEKVYKIFEYRSKGEAFVRSTVDKKSTTKPARVGFLLNNEFIDIKSLVDVIQEEAES